MAEIKAEQVELGMKIIDQMDQPIRVTSAWPNQGTGLGVVVNGVRLSDGVKSHNRYINPETMVQMAVDE